MPAERTRPRAAAETVSGARGYLLMLHTPIRQDRRSILRPFIRVDGLARRIPSLFRFLRPFRIPGERTPEGDHPQWQQSIVDIRDRLYQGNGIPECPDDEEQGERSPAPSQPSG